MATQRTTDAPQTTSEARASVPTDAVFTIDDLALYLKLPKRTLYKLAQEGAIPGHKIGRHWRFLRRQIEQCFETPRDAGP